MKTTTRMQLRLTLRSGLYIIGGIAILALVWINMRDSILGTPLVVRTAPDGTTLTSAVLPIKGSARHARELLINGRPITMNRDGSFADEILLSPGYNIVEVALRDQFGNQKTKTYQFVMNPATTVAVNPDTPYQ